MYVEMKNIYKQYGSFLASDDVSFGIEKGKLVALLGPSGSGKSHRLHRDIITWAEKEPGRSFLFLVPDQFTMQTQLDLVNASKKKGIMNIDVLSFGRLAHRIFEETGFTTETVLDDTGKSLILRRIAEKHRENLSVI